MAMRRGARQTGPHCRALADSSGRRAWPSWRECFAAAIDVYDTPTVQTRKSPARSTPACLRATRVPPGRTGRLENWGDCYDGIGYPGRKLDSTRGNKRQIGEEQTAGPRGLGTLT